MNNKVLKKRVKYLKETKEGLEKMSGAFEKVRKEGIEVGEQNKMLEIAKAMLKDKLPLEVIVKYTGLSLEKVHSLNIA